MFWWSQTILPGMPRCMWQTTHMTVKTLWDKFIVHYWLPKKILMDQGQTLGSQLVTDLCELMGMWKIWTSPYHPQTNGQCERFNSTLINMLGMWPKERKSEWKNHMGTLVHVYNCTQNSAMEFSPYYLMYGRQPHLPVNVTLGLAPHTIMEPSTSKFVQKMRECAKWAQRKAEAFQAEEDQQHKRKYNKRGKAAALEVGDMVLVRVTTFKGCHKIQDRWENREYVVEKQPYPNVPVYVVCPRDGKGHSQTLHRNYLLPINPDIEQDEKDKPMAGVGNTTSPTPAPPVDSAPTDAGSSAIILVCRQVLDQLASGMHGLACVSVCILYFACVPFSGEAQCKTHSTCTIICLPSNTHFSIQGNFLNGTSEVDCGVGKGGNWRTFGPIATPLPE